jgi:hypothetical protein
MVALPCLPTPDVRLLKTVKRSLGLVDPKLIELFHSLVTGRAKWPLFLYGPAGGGKTAAALALCDLVPTATYATVEDLADATMCQDSDLWYRAAVKHLAVLDELGARERVGDLHYNAVKRFADLREMHCGRVAIYISNVKPEHIQDIYDDRVASRVLAGTWFELAGRDRRAEP